MRTLRILAFGKLKTPGLRESLEYYQRLTQTYFPLEIIELKPEVVTDKSPGARARVQEREMATLAKVSDPRAQTYLLDEAGKILPTRDWAKCVEQWKESSASTLQFCIGSSLGFPKETSAIKDLNIKGRLSLGPQTLSHDLARVVLTEQIYRALSLLAGHPYHVDG